MLVWRSEDKFWELVLSFLCVGYGDPPQVVRHGDKYLYLLSHLAGPSRYFLKGGHLRFHCMP